MDVLQKVFSPAELEGIRDEALRQGFAEVRFIPAADPVEAWQGRYRQYLKRGYHAAMKYLENVTSKFSPRKIYEPVQTIAVFTLPYLHAETAAQNDGFEKTDSPVSFEGFEEKPRYTMARYAQGRDYHRVVREKLETVNSLSNVQGRIVCDTTPLPERYYAALSGHGFIGKNSMLIDPAGGSYFFLAFVLFDRSLPEGWPAPGERPASGEASSSGILFKDGVYDLEGNIEKFCGSCDRCLKACPGGALDGSGYLNSQRCYSFWSIENRLDHIGAKFRKMTSIFGCDICQEVCPYNAHPVTTTLDDFKVSEISREIMRGNLQAGSLEGAAFQRTGATGLKRNRDFIDGLS